MDENQDTNEGAQGAKKAKSGKLGSIVVGVVILLAGSVAGTFFGSKLLGGKGVAEAAPAGAAQEDPDHKVVSVEFDPIVMDLRDAQNGIHHIKVGLAVELADKQTPDEFHSVMPRGREAVLSYLRTLTFEDISKQDLFQKIRSDLADTVSKAVGEKRVTRVLLVDFVSE